MQRRETIETGKVYHIFSKSIAGFRVFHNEHEFLRIRNMLGYYQLRDMPCGFAHFLRWKKVDKKNFDDCFRPLAEGKSKLIQIIAYCCMPTHLHLVLKQLEDGGISFAMGNLLNSYSRYFNTKYERKGPLWEGKFKNVSVEDNDQLMHLTRYVHLNPVTACLVDKPQDWPASSYSEYLHLVEESDRLCEYGELFDIEPKSYRSFTENQISHQKELGKIKNVMIDEA